MSSHLALLTFFSRGARCPSAVFKFNLMSNRNDTLPRFSGGVTDTYLPLRL